MCSGHKSSNRDNCKFSCFSSLYLLCLKSYLSTLYWWKYFFFLTCKDHFIVWAFPWGERFIYFVKRNTRLKVESKCAFSIRYLAFNELIHIHYIKVQTPMDCISVSGALLKNLGKKQREILRLLPHFRTKCYLWSSICNFEEAEWCSRKRPKLIFS